MSGKWNRSARRSGGHKPVSIPVPQVSREDIEFLAMIEKVRKEFGEEGVKRFYEFAAARVDGGDVEGVGHG
jgi:hypothetical protein